MTEHTQAVEREDVLDHIERLVCIDKETNEHCLALQNIHTL